MPTELIVLIVILLFLFGGKAVAGLGKTTGETVKEIRKVKKEFTQSLEDDDSKPSKISKV